MKKVRLLQLELTNYRNIAHEVYNFDGANSKIIGENRIGKTNTLEAIYFLLSNYLLDGSSDLSNIKPLDDTSKEVQVEGHFEVEDNGETRCIVLKKTYGENWVKTRGTDEFVFKGHYEEYFVNGIKQSKEKDFYNLLKELFGVRNDEKGIVDEIQMLTNPLYLGNLGDGDTKEWQMLRKFIVDLIGNVDDKEIFIKEPSTEIIKQDLLNAFSKVDQLKKQYKDQSESMNTQLIGFDSQIELLEKTDNPTDEEIETAKARIDEIEKEKEELSPNKADSVCEQLEKEIYALSKDIVEKNRVEFDTFVNNSGQAKAEAEHKAQIERLYSEINELTKKSTSAKVNKAIIETNIKTLTAQREQLAHDYKDYETRINGIDKVLIKECPTCHRPFEEHEVEERKKETLETYNKMKLDIANEGKGIANRLAIAKEELAKIEKVIDELLQEINAKRVEVGELESSKLVEKPVFVESQELASMREKEKALKLQLNDRKLKLSQIVSDNYAKIEQLELSKKEQEKILSDRDYYERQMNVLQSVKEQRKNVSKSLIQVEQKKEALALYNRTFLKLLDEKIGKVFGKIKFALVKENINGGFDPICKPYIYDVEKDESTDVLWKNGSKSERITTGIAIVEAIKKERCLSDLPYLFDEGGEISNGTLAKKFKTDAQIICVKVEDNIMKPIVVKF